MSIYFSSATIDKSQAHINHDVELHGLYNDNPKAALKVDLL
jgi:hypothetical protein